MKQEIAVPLIPIAIASIIAYSDCGDSGYTENNCPLWMEFPENESELNAKCDAPQLGSEYYSSRSCKEDLRD